MAAFTLAASHIPERNWVSAPSYPLYFKNVVAALFLAIMCLSIFLVRFKVAGLPLRTMFVFALLGLVAMTSPALLLRAVRDQAFALILIAFAAFCAALASISAGNAAAAMIGQMVELHLQAVLGVILGTAVLRICGARMAATLFVAPIAVSVVFAILQFVGFQGAWDVYDAIAALQYQTTSELWFYDVHERALGLSYSPVLLGTQTCLLFAVLFGVFAIDRDTGQAPSSLNSRILLLIGVVGLAAIAAGNRSPLLGIAIFLGAFLCRMRPLLGLAMLAAIPLALILGDAITEIMNDSGLRVLNTENSSGEGRATLRAYGWLLFLGQPLGYGLSFNSLDHWWQYWDAIQHYDNPLSITVHALHNFYLMTLNKHGVFILLVIPLVIRRLALNPVAFFAFLPYIVHLFYHNDGPLQGDFLFWYILPFFSAIRKPLQLGP